MPDSSSPPPAPTERAAREELARCNAELASTERRLEALRARRAVRLALALADSRHRVIRMVRGEHPDPRAAMDSPSSAPSEPARPEPRDEPRFYWPSLTHFHSPVPDTRILSLEASRARIWPEAAPQRRGIDWRGEQQLALVGELAKQTPLRFPEEPTADPLEYYAPNPSFGYYDSWAMGAMLRHLRPARMIETGSGWTTLLAARVNREYLNGEMELTCIDPYPQEFLSGGVDGLARLMKQPVEETPPATFEQLDAGDVLFIDGTHAVKTGGDVVFLFGEVIPRLRRGVVVHVHDIFLPRDYPEQWVLSGWGWNEQYLLQAFLAFNPEFEIVLGMAWLTENHPDVVADAAPGPAHERPRFEASLWFRRR